MPAECQVNNIDIDLIYSNTIEENIISINTKKELFFDVYECIINDETLILEKVGDSELGPKVLLEINIEGKKYSAEAILVDNGSTYVELNKENIYFIRTIPDENLTVEESEVEESVVVDETSDNVDVNYENIIEHHVNNKLVFLHELEEQFEEKIVSLKDDISNKLDLFFEKLEDKKKVIVDEKLEEITLELDEKYKVLKSELHQVEDFSKKNIDNILETKIKEIDSSVGSFLEGITKEYKNKIISSDKKITHNFLELNSIKEKLKENNSTTNKKFKELNILKEKLLEQDNLVLKNKELKKFINEEFENINSKFKNLSKEESKKYDELLAAVNNKDVVEYKTILKEKIQDVELTQIKKSLQEEISSALKGDIVSLKRYVEMSSGGGSNAVQYANGGIMDGTLNVTGDILSGGTNLIDIFNSDTLINLQDVTDNGNTTTNIISSNNTIIADTIIATTLLSAGTTDINFELSGFSVTGDISANGNLYVTENINLSGDLFVDGLVDSRDIAADGAAIDNLDLDVNFLSGSIDNTNLDVNFLSGSIDNTNLDVNFLSGSIDNTNLQTVTDRGNTTTNSIQVVNLSASGSLSACGSNPNYFASNVGIGTTTPSEKLDVTGNIKASGFIKSNALFKLDVPDSGGAPATTAIIDINGYEGRGAGIKIQDSKNSASGASNREWFIGTGYSQVGFNIGYASDGNQSSYAAQNKLSISTSGNVIVNNNLTAITLSGTSIKATDNLTTVTLSATNIKASDNLTINTLSGSNIKASDNITAVTLSATNIKASDNITGVTLSATNIKASNNLKTNTLSAGDIRVGKITGGTNTNASGNDSFVGSGNNNNASGNCSSIVGGAGNVASGTRSSIGNGYNSTASGNYSAIVSGRKAYAVGHYSFIGGSGYQNRAKCSNSFIGNGIYNCTNGYQASVVNGYYNHALGNNSSIVGGQRNQACASKSSVVGGSYNCAIGVFSSIVGGTNNRASGTNSFIAGGALNCVNVGHNCSFIIGTGITSNAACTTFVNNLSSQGIVNGCSITSYEGVKVGSGSIISCNASFTPSLSDNGRTLLLDTTSGSIVVTVTPQISGFTTRYIKEAGAAPVVFSTGTGLSGLYSYQDRNQMSIIYAQADIFFKSNNYAFLGGNLQ